MPKTTPSIMKSIFQGEVLEELAFPYPTINEDEADMVKIITDNFLKWAGENYDPSEADEQAAYPEGTLEALAEMGLFGLNVPESDGGLGLSQTAYAKVYETVSSIDGSLPVTIGGHSSIGVKGLLLYGTEEQKRRYLPDLASGKKLAAFALTEPGAGSDAFCWRVTERIRECRDDAPRTQDYVSRRMIIDYGTYVRYRNELVMH